MSPLLEAISSAQFMPISGAFFASLLIEKQLEKLEMLTCFLSFFLLLPTDGKKAFSREEESSWNHIYHSTSRQGCHSPSLVWRLGEMQGKRKKRKRRSKWHHMVVVVQLLSLSDCFATPWPVAHKAPLSMGFSRQEYWSGLHFLLQGIFSTQGSNPWLLHCKWIPYHWATREAQMPSWRKLKYLFPKASLGEQKVHKARSDLFWLQT